MNKELAKELIRRGKLDQDMRNRFLKDGTWNASIDYDNTDFMKRLVSEGGWPKISEVGKKAANIAWLLVQHADHDLTFQKECLKLIQKLDEGEVNKADVAYLVDRILVAEGKPQIYGTQFYNEANRLTPRKIKDKANLDKRRREVGLESFKSYKKTMQQYASQSKNN